MKQLSKIFFIIFLSPGLVYAQNLTDGQNLYDNGTNANNRYDEMDQFGQRADDQLDLGDDRQLTNVDGFTNTDSGARNNGEQSQNDSNSTQILGLIMGAAFAAMCGPKNPAACVMAAMSFADAAASGRNSSNSAAFQNQLLPNGQTLTGNEGVDAGAQEGLSKLNELGYAINSDGSVTTPEGETLTSEDFASVQSLTDKGLTPEQAQNALDLFKQVSADAQKQVAELGEKKGNAFAIGDDGGFTSGSVTIIDEGPESSRGKKSKNINKSSKKGARLPASELAGLKKNFNGEPIGIGLANIFLIVKKKYEDKDKERSFLKKEY